MLRFIDFRWAVGRNGTLSGRFVVDDAGWAKLNATIGKLLYFGEVLGKHSEVQGFLGANDFEVITDDQAFLQRAAELRINLNSGYNPLNNIADERD